MPAPYPEEFRRRAVELARAGDKPVAQIARELNVAQSGLRRWLAQADVDEGTKPGLTRDERKEMAADAKRYEHPNRRSEASNMASTSYPSESRTVVTRTRNDICRSSVIHYRSALQDPAARSVHSAEEKFVL